MQNLVVLYLVDICTLMRSSLKIYLFILCYVFISFIYFFLFNLRISSVCFFVLITAFILVLLIVVSRNSIDLDNVKRLSEMVNLGDLNFSPKFYNRELNEIENSINGLKNKLSDLLGKSMSVDKIKEDFIYLVSHNLRTPVTSSLGYLDILKSNQNLTNEDIKIIERVRLSLTELNDIVERILSLIFFESEKNPISVENIDVEGEIGEIIASQENDKHLSIGVSLNDIKNIKTDRRIFKIIVSNIISNSIKFNNDNGIISVSLRKEKDFFVLSISDSGIGMDDKAMKELFQPFTRNTSLLKYDYSGIGLGLYLSKIGIEKLGGNITVDSAKDKGTVFSLYFPVLN